MRSEPEDNLLQSRNEYNSPQNLLIRHLQAEIPFNPKDTPHLWADLRFHLYQEGPQKIGDNPQTPVARPRCGTTGLKAFALSMGH